MHVRHRILFCGFKSNILNCFKVIHCVLKYQKPHPPFFLHACGQLKTDLGNGERCVNETKSIFQNGVKERKKKDTCYQYSIKREKHF